MNIAIAVLKWTEGASRMKDNEIIKALECCKSTEHCGHCSYDKDHSEIAGCTAALAKDALNLINRQKAEIAKLEKVEKYADETIKAQAAEIERLEKARQKQAQFLGEERGQKYELIDKLSKANTEIERLEEMFDSSVSSERNVVDNIGYEKSEAIKEFAERLKIEAFECDVSFGYGKECYQQAVAVIEIDNLVKEMTEVNENE